MTQVLDGHSYTSMIVVDESKERVPSWVFVIRDGKLLGSTSLEFTKVHDRLVVSGYHTRIFDKDGKQTGEFVSKQKEGLLSAAFSKDRLLCKAKRAGAAVASLLLPRPLAAEGEEAEDACNKFLIEAGKLEVKAAEALAASLVAAARCKLFAEADQCMAAESYGEAAANYQMQANAFMNLWLACKAGLTPPPPPPPPPPPVPPPPPPPPPTDERTGPGGGGGPGPGTTCWYLVTYYVDTGEIISVQLLYCE